MIRPLAMGWVENSRHILPVGRCGSRKAVGSLWRSRVPPHVVNGITIAHVAVDEKPEEEPYDDF